MKTALRIAEGQPYPLGATWDGRGVNFALFSANATKVELCLFDRDGKRETAREGRSPNIAARTRLVPKKDRASALVADRPATTRKGPAPKATNPAKPKASPAKTAATKPRTSAATR